MGKLAAAHLLEQAQSALQREGRHGAAMDVLGPRRLQAVLRCPAGAEPVLAESDRAPLAELEAVPA